MSVMFFIFGVAYLISIPLHPTTDAEMMHGNFSGLDALLSFGIAAILSKLDALRKQKDSAKEKEQGGSKR